MCVCDIINAVKSEMLNNGLAAANFTYVAAFTYGYRFLKFTVALYISTNILYPQQAEIRSYFQSNVRLMKNLFLKNVYITS